MDAVYVARVLCGGAIQAGRACGLPGSIDAQAQSVIRNSDAVRSHSDAEPCDQLMRTLSTDVPGRGRGTVKEPNVIARS